MAVEVDPFDAMFETLVREDNKGDGAAGVKHVDAPNPPPEAAAAGAPPVVSEGLAPLAADAAANKDLPPGVVEAPSEIEGAPLTPEEQAAADTAAAAAATEAAAAAEAAKKKQPTDDALTRIADLLADRRAAPAPNIMDAPQPTRQQFSPEDTAFLTQYHADFGDVAKAESMLRRAEYNLLTTHIFQEVAKTFGPRMALLEQLADGAAYTALTAQVPDYDVNRDKVVDWVKTQPAYLQAAYNHVIQNGTVTEITDLFNRYSKETGAPAPAAQVGAGGTGGAPPEKTAVELSSAVKAVAARLAPVNTKRSAPTQGAPTSFEDAFAMYAREPAKT